LITVTLFYKRKGAARFHAKSAKEQRAQRKLALFKSPLSARCVKLFRGGFHAKSAKEQRAQRKLALFKPPLRARCVKLFRGGFHAKKLKILAGVAYFRSIALMFSYYHYAFSNVE